MTHPQAYILSAARTPVGKLQGSLSHFPAAELGAHAIKHAVRRANLPRLEDIDEVIMGNVLAAGLGQNIARQCAIKGGLPPSVGAFTLNKVCGASLKGVMLATQAIRLGDSDLFVCGGVESMSQAPHLIYGRLNQLKFGEAAMKDSVYVDGLHCAFEDWAMGMAGEFIAEEFDISRAEMDSYAFQSHRKAIKAIDEGRFKQEIVPIQWKDKKGNIQTVDTDESIRRNTSIEALTKLKPAFKEGGRITAGNAPGLNDAAAALVIGNAASIPSGLTPMARIAGYAQIAVEPKYIFDAPAKVIPKLLHKLNWKLSDVDLFEINEAFAAQILANGKSLASMDWKWEKVNIYGGGIALGHPFGATGARLLTTLVYALQARGEKKGIAGLCLGGGEAIAIAIEVD